MNRSGPEWVDHDWNPITGCKFGCKYCYAPKIASRFSGDVRLNKMAKKDYTIVDGVYVLEEPMKNETGNNLGYPFGFEPTFHMHRLDTMSKIKTGNNILVGTMGDMFGNWIPDNMLDIVFERCEEYERNNYLFLTRNPERYCQYRVPMRKNLWYGTTVTSGKDVDRISCLPGKNAFVAIEPLLGEIKGAELGFMIDSVEWVIIGAQTGYRAPKPKSVWVQRIVEAAQKKGKPVFMLDSLKDVVEGKLLKEFPEQLQERRLSDKMYAKMYACCNVCGETDLKAKLIGLSARMPSNGQIKQAPSKQYAHMCKQCFEKHCLRIGIDYTKIMEE